MQTPVIKIAVCVFFALRIVGAAGPLRSGARRMEQWSGTECARNPGKPDPSLAAVRQAERGERPDKKIR